MKENNELFGEVISTYTVNDAIEDGIFLDAGRFYGFRVVATTNFIETFEKYALVAIMAQAMEGTRKAIAAGMSDIIHIKTGVKTVWVSVDISAKVVTIMLPEDY